MNRLYNVQVGTIELADFTMYNRWGLFSEQTLQITIVQGVRLLNYEQWLSR